MIKLSNSSDRSFGHFQAKEYGVADGYHSNMDDEQIRKVKEGFCKTRISVTKVCFVIGIYVNIFFTVK